MSNAVLILGTDTAVGKTFVSCALLLGLRQRNVPVSALKPVETGFDPEYENSDARLLAAAAGEEFLLERHVPLRLEAPLAPYAAALREGRAVDIPELLRTTRARVNADSLLVTELAGGLRVPLSEGVTNVEFAQELGWPAILVARAGLGTINHTALSCEVAANAGIEILGFILNGDPDRSSTGQGSNRDILERMTKRPCLGELQPQDSNGSASFVLDAARRASEDLHWPTILRVLNRTAEANSS